jgi:hypothetical protein
MVVARQYFRQQVQFAEDAQDRQSIVKAYNNFAGSWLQSNDPHRALAWVQLALFADVGNVEASQFKKQIDEKLRSAISTSVVSGLFAKYSGRAYWDTVRMDPPVAARVHFTLLAYRIGFNWREFGPASYGDLNGQALLSDSGKVTYKGDEPFETCRVTFGLRDGHLSVVQTGECGFGRGVSINGDWLFVCSGAAEDCRKTPSGEPID